MHPRLQRVIGIGLSVLLGLGTLVAIAAPAQAQEEFDVLVFSKTAGFRHGSIPDGIAAIEELGEQHNFGVTATEDASRFTTENLQQYEAVIWLSTTGDVLNDSQQAAFEEYISGGGGYVGIHAAADTEYEWSFYGDLVGAYFDSHPQIQEAEVTVTDRVHPSTQHLPKTWTRTDEWYNYATNPRGDVHVLAALDESSYAPGDGAMGADHPIAWCQDHQGGRSWYTGMGHTPESFSDPQFRDHVLGGIQTAAGAVESDCGASDWSNFDQVTMAQGPDEVGEPMGMAILPGGGVLHSERQGTLYHTTAEGETSVAAEVPVYTHDEEGLQSIALDPDFAQNGWVYLYYAPPLDTPSGDAPETSDDPSVFEEWKGHNQLSRFKFTDGELDLSSEQQIMQVDASRGMCCHVGGDIDFGPDGHLYLSTGDDTNPFQSSGYSPIDERETRYPAFDGQRTSANTDDLRGKLLRVDVGSDGSYTIPDGNMFAGDGSDQTRGEIYAMGFRNPYRFTVDDETGVVYLGDYGPDAGSADPDRGPAGQVEFNRITEPGFYGWPYCTGANDAYHDYDFATGESGPEFDCAGGPANDSPNNDGRAQLPPAVPAWLPYDDDSVPEFGGGSESPMGGPVYRHDADSESQRKFPAYYDGKFFAYEWGRGWIKPLTIGANGEPLKIEPFFPSMELTRPMDIEFGPDGSLYVLDYGSGFFGGAEDSALYRIDYVKGNRAPHAAISAEPTSGRGSLEVEFSSEGSGDPDPGSSIAYAWDFDGDGETDSTEPNPTYTYTENGEYTATLTVTDNTGKTGTASETIVVGNTAPDVSIRVPKDGQVFDFGDTVNYTVTVKDPDGVKFDCSKVEVEYILGHSTDNDAHGHPLSQSSGCQGTIETANTDGHQGADIYGVLHASYTDTSPTPEAPALTGEDEAILQPKTKQAEYFSGSQGVQVVQNDDAQAGERVGYINPGNWISFQPYNLAGVDSMSVRISSGGQGGTIEVHSGSPEGPLVATVEVPNTGGYSSYEDVGPVPVDDPGGTTELFLVFQGSGSGGLFDVDSFVFHGKGAASTG